MKRTCGTFLVHIHVSLAAKFQYQQENLSNISAMELITGLLTSIHNSLRQQLNNNQGSMNSKVSEDLIIRGISNKKADVVALVKKIAGLYGLKYAKGEEWLGTFGPILSLVRGFTFNTIEARIGVDKVQLGNQGRVLAATYVSNYGVMPEHHVLGVGMSYPPTIKSNLPNTLGPAVALIQLIRTPHNYQDKWKRVLKRHISHIPDSDAIIDTLVRAKTAAECRSMVNILLLTTPRTTNRAFLPAAIFTCHTDKALYDAAVAGNDTAWPLFDISFSGVKAASAFNKAKDLLYYKCYDAVVGSQMVFHGVWRSHNENLDLLKWMTETEFKHRSTIGALLQNKLNAPVTKLTLLLKPQFLLHSKKLDVGEQLSLRLD